MDNLILRIPVLAGACLLHYFVYYGLHRVLGQAPSGDVVVTAAYSLIGTTIAGTLVYMFLQSFSTDKVRRKKRDMFSQRRQTRRRNPIRLNK
jgi:peptidoglycan/LPS O-acetylase OafA/YrhL